MRRPALVVTLVVGAALVLAGAAVAGNGGFAPATPQSPNANRINDAYDLIAIPTGIILVLVEASLIVFVVRYRRGRRPRDAEGPQMHGATRLELIWTAIPVLILAAIAAFIFYKLPGIKDVPKAKAGNEPVEIRIDAHQFYWQFTYPNGVVSIDELHAPVGKVVKVDIHSQDVDHSWWIPELGGKFDAIPGVVNHTWFRARRIGTYRGQCGEFCGVFHAAMNADVKIESQAAYERWVSAGAATALGKSVWTGVCAKCHGLAGKGDYGPPISGSPILVDSAQLKRLLENGRDQPNIPGVMPPVGRDWTGKQLDALLAYVRKNVAGGAGGA
ncbi:MAG TPA: cytochrome c oxidase subunit II [Gaiellaceae bacterium]